jgi:hypothetical protein
VGPASQPNLISHGQSELKNESQPDAPSRPYPRSSWSPARYLQAYLNASCTSCSPVAGPNFLPCVGSCVPYKFARNPSLLFPCCLSLPRVPLLLLPALAPVHPLPPPAHPRTDAVAVALPPCCSCPCAASTARRHAPPCAACRPVLPCAAPPAAVLLWPIAHTRTPPAPVRPFPLLAQHRPLLQLQPPLPRCVADSHQCRNGTETAARNETDSRRPSSRVKFDLYDASPR